VSAPPLVVLVDARNVVRSRWPNMNEERFVDLARAWATERKGARLVLVFDGQAPGSVLGAAELDERAALVGTGRESADDWIAREAGRLAQEDLELWLVTSDRGLRAIVGPNAARLIGGGTFASELEAIEVGLDA
jgi:predicted RNA-binding protein with PIN domain